MSNVSGSFGSLLGGISQQPAVVRAEGQCEDLLNGMLRPIDGLTDREPFIAAGGLPGMTPSMRLHQWDAGDGNKYIAGVGGGQVKVWDWDGNAMAVTVDTTAAPYIAADGAYLHTANVGDYLMVTNNTVVVQPGAATGVLAEAPTFWIKNVRWGQRIAVWANISIAGATHRFEFAYTSPDGTITTDTEGSDASKANTKFIDPSYVVWRWQYWLQNNAHPADFAGPEQWMDVKHSLATVTVTVPAVISSSYVMAFDGATFTGPSNIAAAGQAVSAVGTDNPEGDVVAVFRTVGSVDELPPRSYDGHIVEVSQDDTGDFSFYMRFIEDSTSPPVGSTPVVEHECMMWPERSEYDLGFKNDGLGDMADEWDTPIGEIRSCYIYHDGMRRFYINASGGPYASIHVRTAGQLVTLTPDGGSYVYKAEDQDEIFEVWDSAASSNSSVAVYIREPTPVAGTLGMSNVVAGIPSGKWRETYKPGLQTSLQATTMPHALVRTGPTSFHFIVMDGRQIPGIAYTESWTSRNVGDDDSNPLPDFVGGTLRGIGVYKDRMYLYGGEAMRFSKIGLYWDLFIESAVEGGDDDGFDVTTVTGKVQNIRYCVPHQQSLVVFAEQGQFIMDGSQVLTPGTAALIPVTSFLLNHDVEPQPAGDVVYFTDSSGVYSHVREFYLDSITATNNARPITSHVDHLIPADVRQLIASAEDGLLVVIPKWQTGVAYIYQYVVDNGQRVQSAWHRWQVVGFNLLYGWVHRGTLYVVATDRVGAYHIGKMDLDTSVTSDRAYIPRLDGFKQTTGVGATISIGLDGALYPEFQFQLASGPYIGTVLNVKAWGADGVVHFYDDISGMVVSYGAAYPFRFEPTRPFPVDNRGRKITDRITIMQFVADLESTGPFDLVLRSDYYPEFRIPVDRVVGSPNAVLGETPTMSGRAPIMVNMNTEHIRASFEKTHPMPFNLVNLDYRGRYTKRSTRI